MSERLRKAARAVVDEWHADHGSVRMASVVMALEAALAEQGWTPDDTAHRPGGLPQDCPAMDLGGDISATTGLAGGLVHGAHTLPERVENLAENKQAEPVDWEAVAADQAMTIAMLRTEIAALAEQEVEPVAWMYIRDDEDEIERRVTTHRWHRASPLYVEVPLFAYPPRREWQGLTTGEREQAWQASKGDMLSRLSTFANEIERLLKEKNHD